MTKKIDIETVFKSYELEALSPRAYDDMVYNIKHKIKMEIWNKKEILASFDVPMLIDTSVSKQYKTIENIIKERLAFEKRKQSRQRLMRKYQA